MSLPIFLFHRVSPVKDNWGIAMDPELFEKTIRYLTNHFSIQTVENYFQQEHGREKGALPDACVTFDDGFKDNIEYAAPILKKYNCPASFYIVTDSIDKNIPTWVDIYKHFFEKTCISHLKIESSHFTGKQIEIQFTSNRERNEYGKALFEKIKKLPNSSLMSILDQIQESFYDVELPEKPMLSWEDVNQLKNDGFNIGSHTKTHPFLSSLANDKAILSEFSESGERIRQMTGHFPYTISYPAGDFDNCVIKLARQAGYQLGLKVTQERYKPFQDDIMQIPRIDLYADAGWTKTYLRINGALQKIKELIPDN